jgi:hypothetical protein
MEVQLEAVFSMWSAPRLYHSIDRVPISSVSSRQGDGNEVIVSNSSVPDKETGMKLQFRTVQLLASRRPGKEHQSNQWSETRRTTGPVIVVTVTVIVKVSANKTNIFQTIAFITCHGHQDS